MKIIQQEAKYSIEMSQNDWEKIGEQNNWVKTSQVDNSYVNESEVWIYLSPQTPNYDNLDVHRVRTFVKFLIEVEARSWGIKSLVVTISKIEPIHAIVTEFNVDKETEKDLTIEIDATKLKLENVPSRGTITTGNIELYLNPDFSVDYNQSRIEIFTATN